jgi:drug/metabolite transporter (DMT)-like permease
VGYISALTGVVAFSVSTISMSKISHASTAESTQLLSIAVICIVGVVGCLLQPMAAPAVKTLAMMIIAGVINIVANIFYNRSLQNTASTNVAQLHYTQIIWGAILAYFIWNDVPTWNLVVGSVVIILSGLVVAHQAHKTRKT